MQNPLEKLGIDDKNDVIESDIDDIKNANKTVLPPSAISSMPADDNAPDYQGGNASSLSLASVAATAAAAGGGEPSACVVPVPFSSDQQTGVSPQPEKSAPQFNRYCWSNGIDCGEVLSCCGLFKEIAKCCNCGNSNCRCNNAPSCKDCGEVVCCCCKIFVEICKHSHHRRF